MKEYRVSSIPGNPGYPGNLLDFSTGNPGILPDLLEISWCYGVCCN